MTSGPFPDPEAALADLLGDLAEAVYAGTQTLAAVTAGKLPAIRIKSTPGTDDRVTQVTPVSIDVFAPDRATAWSVAAAVRDRLLGGPFASPVSWVTAHGRIDRARTIQAPTPLIPPNAALPQCTTASYRISTRR